MKYIIEETGEVFYCHREIGYHPRQMIIIDLLKTESIRDFKEKFRIKGYIDAFTKIKKMEEMNK